MYDKTMFVQVSGDVTNPKFAGMSMVKQPDGSWTIALKVK